MPQGGQRAELVLQSKRMFLTKKGHHSLSCHHHALFLCSLPHPYSPPTSAAHSALRPWFSLLPHLPASLLHPLPTQPLGFPLSGEVLALGGLRDASGNFTLPGDSFVEPLSRKTVLAPGGFPTGRRDLAPRGRVTGPAGCQCAGGPKASDCSAMIVPAEASIKGTGASGGCHQGHETGTGLESVPGPAAGSETGETAGGSAWHRGQWRQNRYMLTSQALKSQAQNDRVLQ